MTGAGMTQTPLVLRTNQLVSKAMNWARGEPVKTLFAAIGVVSTIILATAPARAQTWLDPAFANGSAFGPSAAAGAVIWSHGRSVDSEDSEAPTPPYLAVLHDGGWDTFRFNRMRAGDRLAASAQGLVEQVHRLRQKGYRKVALAGQSFGAFLSLMAADSTDEVDAVIATAPAAYGSFSDLYGSWRSNATELYPILAQVRTARVMVFYFQGDDFDPGGRGEHTRAILTSRGLSHVVVDQPPLLTTHWAAATPQFARLFGACILGFLDAPRVDIGARCDHGASFAGDFALVSPGPATSTAALAQPARGSRGAQ
jgi:dienelactone hydrolase